MQHATTSMTKQSTLERFLKTTQAEQNYSERLLTHNKTKGH
jgi:hypothetical protein